MKRTGFAPQTAPRPAKRMDDYTPRPRSAAVAVHDGNARMVLPAPKTPYVRDERLREMCRALPCQCCGRSDPDAGVTWAHSNWADHGKGRGIKASDIYVAAMCWVCHSLLDQGGTISRAGKRLMWERAHAQTVAAAQRGGLWPAGIQIPVVSA